LNGIIVGLSDVIILARTLDDAGGGASGPQWRYLMNYGPTSRAAEVLDGRSLSAKRVLVTGGRMACSKSVSFI